MHLRYDDDLLEAAAIVCTSGRRRGIPSLRIARFHRERERLYSILDPDERNAAFFKLHLEWFREWGLERALTDVAAEFPLLNMELNRMAFRKARNQSEEGAELYVQRGTDASVAQSPAVEPKGETARRPIRNAVVALRPERFEEDQSVACFLRHEFTHLHDMVNPAFGYQPELNTDNPGRQRIARERYRMLWDITIDGRLCRSGHTPRTSRAEHEAAFSRGYAFWHGQKQREAFDELWNAQSPSHERLAHWSCDPRDQAHARGPAPGASCPLCGFPTFDWTDASTLPLEVACVIQREFPLWEERQGLCSRCAEVYQANETDLISQGWHAHGTPC